MEKVSKATSFSTILIGIYMVLLSCLEIGAILFCKIAGDATMTGVNITAMTGGSDDYISGYLIVPRILGTVFSGMAEITVLLLAAVLVSDSLVFSVAFSVVFSVAFFVSDSDSVETRVVVSD